MIRKQVYIREDQDSRLKALAAVTGKAEAELIRDGLDRVLAEEEAKKQDWKKVWLEVAGIWKDHDEIDEIIAENRRRVQKRMDRLFEGKYKDDQDDDAA